jgi:4-hydroxy-3-polyprenylbenzoate decarboxylase
MGVVILPPVPAFYNRPQSIEEMVDQTVMRILDQFDIHLDLTRRWDGEMLPGGATMPAGSKVSD